MKNLLISALLICLSQFASGQRHQEGNKEIESYKVAYLTNKLELTSFRTCAENDQLQKNN